MRPEVADAPEDELLLVEEVELFEAVEVLESEDVDDMVVMICPQNIDGSRG